MANAKQVVAKFVVDTIQKMENVAVDIGYDIADRAMMQAPVYTGQYKASMRASVNEPDTTREPNRDRSPVQGPLLSSAQSIGAVGSGGEVVGQGDSATDAMYNQVYLDFDHEDKAIYISNSTSYEQVKDGAAAIEFESLAVTTPEGVLLVAYEAAKSNLNSVIARAISE